MADGLDIELVEKFYSKLSDSELARIIFDDARGLTPQAIEVVKKELAKRNANTEYYDVIDAKNKNYTNEELDVFCRSIESLPCPACKKTSAALTGVVLYRTMSFIIFTRHTKKLSIGCPDCLQSQNIFAAQCSLFLGWWGIPWGPIRTVQSLRNFFKASAIINEPGPNDYLRGFVLANIGPFTVFKNDKEKMTMMINKLYSDHPITSF